MAGITSRITVWVMIFCYMTGLVQNLGIVPSVNSAPTIDTYAAFTQVNQPGDYFRDPLLGGAMLVWNAVQAFIVSITNVVLIFWVITQYGIDPIYAATAQSIVLGIYIYDLIAIWKGYEIL